MLNFEVIYEQFLSTTNTNFGNLTVDEIKEELFNWVVLASSYFKFPEVSLDYVKYSDENIGPEGQTSPYFINEVTQKEITVIIEFMRIFPLNLELTDAKKYDQYYQDANLKLPSQSALITQLNRSHENQIKTAGRVESNYYKSKNNKPTIGDTWEQ